MKVQLNEQLEQSCKLLNRWSDLVFLVAIFHFFYHLHEKAWDFLMTETGRMYKYKLKALKNSFFELH